MYLPRSIAALVDEAEFSSGGRASHFTRSDLRQDYAAPLHE